MRTYTYDPSKIGEDGRDRMRFELGDTLTDHDGELAALSDEEYDAVLNMYPGRWRKAKLACLQSICFGFLYEGDLKDGPMALSLRQRAEAWKQMYDELKAEEAAAGVPAANPKAISPAHYFREGMHDHPGAGQTGREWRYERRV